MALSTCTQSFIETNQPCAACVSERDLMAILALILALLNGDSTDANTLLADAACWACFDDRRVLENVVKVFHELAYDARVVDSNVGALRTAAACLACADPKMVRAVIFKQFCTYMGTLQP